MQQEHKNKVIFIGPDMGQDNHNPYFKETKSLLEDWKNHAKNQGLKVRVGRWLIPGKPIAVLVDFNSFWSDKDKIYYNNWKKFGVDSIAAYGDYDESSVFGYATGVVIESIYRYYNMENKAVVAHFNEWMTSFGLFYVKEHLPQVGTVFTTHATSIGRSIAGNNKPLYDYFEGYNGDQMARELNMVAKHSTEKQAAIHADCFTTVSDITAKECRQLLDKPVDVVTPNGFESEFVPKTETALKAKRKVARKKLKEVAEQVLGYELNDNTLFIATGGRYEWKNKGIDLFIDSLFRLKDTNLNREVVAFIMVPAWQQGKHDVLGKVDNITTHRLVAPDADPVINTMRYLGLNNSEQSKVKIIFVPSYLKGDDGIFNMTYYDLLIGLDLTVFPSYYEPWGYTPLESVAFHVPTITTTLAGFGLWALQVKDTKQKPADNLLFEDDSRKSELESGVAVVKRTDSNWNEASTNIAQLICEYTALSEVATSNARNAASSLAERAAWKHFFKHYHDAYSFALRNKKYKKGNK